MTEQDIKRTGIDTYVYKHDGELHLKDIELLSSLGIIDIIEDAPNDEALIYLYADKLFNLLNRDPPICYDSQFLSRAEKLKYTPADLYEVLFGLANTLYQYNIDDTVILTADIKDVRIPDRDDTLS